MMMFFDDFPNLTLYLVIFLPPALFLVLLVVVYFTVKLEVTPKLEILSESRELYSGVAHYFQMVERGLAQESFQAVGKYLAPTLLPGNQSIFLLLLNPLQREVGLVHAEFVIQDGHARMQHCFLELHTEFDDDSSINTTNMEEPYPFRKRPDLIFVQLPSLVDPRELYRVHQHLVREQSGGRRRRWKWTANTLEDLHKELEQSHSRIAQQGYLHPAGNGEFYRLTLKGLLAAFGKLVWPFSALAKAKVRREEERILAEMNHLRIETH